MITIPNLPTDNLYKFLFIAGVILIISGFIIFTTQYKTLYGKIEDIELQIQHIETETNFLKQDNVEFITESKKILKKLKEIKNIDSIDFNTKLQNLKDNLYDKEYREYFSFIIEHKKDILPFYEESKKLEIINEQYHTKDRQITTNLNMARVKNKQLNRGITVLAILGIMTVLLTCFGYIIAKYGYKKWHILVQNPIDEKLQIELKQLKNGIEKTPY